MKGLSERNTLIVGGLSKSIHFQNEMKNLNEDLRIKADDAISCRLTLTKELEEKTHQFESLKLRFTEKVFELEISCSDKDICSKMLEEELVVQKGLLADRDAQTLRLNQDQTSFLQNESCFTLAAEVRASELELWWLVQEGIPSFVHDLLNYADFRDVNVAVQTIAIQFDLHQACVEMNETYVDALEGKNVLYSYPKTQHQVLDRFASMVSYKYSLFKLLEGYVVDVSVFKLKSGALDPSLNRDGASGNV